MIFESFKIVHGHLAGLCGYAEIRSDTDSITGKSVDVVIPRNLPRPWKMRLPFGERSDWHAWAVPMTEREQQEMEHNLKLLPPGHLKSEDELRERTSR